MARCATSWSFRTTSSRILGYSPKRSLCGCNTELPQQHVHCYSYTYCTSVRSTAKPLEAPSSSVTLPGPQRLCRLYGADSEMDVKQIVLRALHNS